LRFGEIQPLPIHASNEDCHEAQGGASEVEQELLVSQCFGRSGGGRFVAPVAGETEGEVGSENDASGHSCDLEGNTSHDEPVSDVEKVVAHCCRRGDATTGRLGEDGDDVAANKLYSCVSTLKGNAE
jgi:hypothetical protein